MKLRLALSLLIGFALGWESTAQTLSPTKIQDVTVYRAGAMVHRSAQNVQLFAGRQTIVFTGIPNQLVSESIKVTLPDGVRLLKTEYRFMTPEEQGFADFESIGKKIEAAEAEMTAEKDLQTSLREDLAFIGANSDLGAGAAVADIKAADTYLAQRRRTIRADLRASFDRLKDLEASAQALRAEFAIMENALGKAESVVEVELDCPSNKRGNITIEYYSTQARWDPFYNVRTDADDKPMSVEFMASIRQNTGESWDDVNLTLSTGDPSLGAQEPDLPTWYVSYRDSYVPAKPYTFAPPSIQQTGTFNALVIDQETGTPLANARVELSSGNDKFIGVSDENGEVRISNLRMGSFNLLCNYLGYRDLNSSTVIDPTPNLQRIRMSRTGVSQMVAVAISPRVYPDQAQAMAVRGARADADVTFIDGVRVRGSSNIPREAIDEVQYMASGTPAQYGDAIGEMEFNVMERGRTSSSAIKTTRNFNRVKQSVSTEYIIDKPYTIESDGASQDVWIATTDIEANYIHRLRPARSERTHLITRIPDWESLELLRGVAHFFVEGTYNGSAVINPEETSDTLELGLGSDPAITMNRERIDANSSRHFFSSKVDETFHYRIKVRNTKSTSVEIEIEEQFPISREDDIKVSEQLAEGASVNAETGIITWKKTLAPGEEYEVEYSFIVTYPKDNNGANLPR